MSFNMTMKKPGKKYGLVKPQSKSKPKPKPGLFAAAAAEDEGEAPMSAKEQVNYAILQAQASEARKKKAEATYAEALDQDASVFDYDGVYDEMQEKRAESAQARKKKESVRAPKYINNILKMAEYKKREEERVKERVEARERLKELEEFGDTEKFVTSAYKRKLEEWQALDQEDARQAAIEAAQVRPDRHGHLPLPQSFRRTNLIRRCGTGRAQEGEPRLLLCQSHAQQRLHGPDARQNQPGGTRGDGRRICSGSGRIGRGAHRGSEHCRR